jgi:hypothetical protein
MDSFPTNPMAQHDRFWSAFCDDYLAGDYHAPRAKAVAQIAKQLNTRDGSAVQKTAPSNSR